jgi:hypothetical protein
MSISIYILPSRVAPYTRYDRTTPVQHSDHSVPRPFDIKHSWRQHSGRSTGGAYDLSNYERMDWIYTVGVTALYQRLMNRYTPVNPWVWIFFPSLWSTEGSWVEAAMQEPHIERSGAIVVQNLVISFHHLSRYEDL